MVLKSVCPVINSLHALARVQLPGVLVNLVSQIPTHPYIF